MRIVAVLFTALTLSVACGGKTFQVPTVSDGGAMDGGSSVSVDGGSDPSTCVDFAIEATDLLCSSDADCASITAGPLCPGDCTCGGTAANAAADARWQAAIERVALGACHCPFEGTPSCVSGLCTLCGGEGQPSCSGATDAGNVSPGECAGGECGTPGSAPGGCAEADFPPSALSCTTASDCVMVPACLTTPSCSSAANGACCGGECYCNGLAVNVQAAPPLAANGPCPAEGCDCGSGVAECFQGQCIMTITCQSTEDCSGAQCCTALGSTPCLAGDAGMCGFCVPAGECGDAG